MPRTFPPIIQLPPPTQAPSASGALAQTSATATANSQTLTLTDLPDDLMRPNNKASFGNTTAQEPSIGNHLDARALCRLSCVCKSLRDALKEEVHIIKEKQLKILLTHIVHGEQAEAEKILKIQPGLLFKKGTVVDYSGRTIVDVTPLQLAWGAEDLEMCQMIRPFFDRFKDGTKDALAQINEKFSDESHNYTPSFYDFRVLVSTISYDLFINSQPNQTTQAILARFRKDFRPGIIKQGKHFNVQHLAQALEVYNQNNDRWHKYQSSLFWHQVIGYIERYLPACYAQAFCQGLSNIVEKHQPLVRNLNLPDSSSYYPLDTGSTNWRLGFEFTVPVPFGKEIAVFGRRCFETLCEEKVMGLRWFKARLQQSHLTESHDEPINSRCTLS